MPSDQELAEFSGHVLYEMAMLVGIPKRFLEPLGDIVTKNALLEAFGIHARQLVKFFYNSANSGEIIASNYFDHPLTEWKMVRPKQSPDLDKLRARVGEEIAHLTVTRLRQQMDWPLFDIVDAIVQRADLFLQHVSPSRIKNDEKYEYLEMLKDYQDYAKEWKRKYMVAAGTDQPINTTTSPIITAKTCPPDNSRLTRF